MRRLVALAAAAASLLATGSPATVAHAAAAPAAVVSAAVKPPVVKRVVVPAPVVRVVTAESFGLHDASQVATAGYGALRLWDTGTTWADLAPRRGAYTWAKLDRYVAKAAARHTRVTLVLGGTPAWAARPGAKVPSASVPTSADWAAYVTAVATRYRGRIDSYQVWNEAALPQFFAGTPSQLADLTVVANARIKAVDKRALVVATGMLPRQSAWTRWAGSYLTALKARRWPVDVFAVHSYQPDAIATPDGRLLTLQRAQALLVAVKAPKRPLWDTEANYTSARYVGHKLGGQLAADYTARAFIDSTRAGVDRTFWYSWNNPVANLGITMTAGSTSQRGLTSVRSWVVGATFRGCTAARARSGAVVTTCRYTRGRATQYVVWANLNARTALPVKARKVCGLLAGCAPVTAKTVVTTSPQLLG